MGGMGGMDGMDGMDDGDRRGERRVGRLLVGQHHRADAVGGEHLDEDRVRRAAVDDVRPADAALDGPPAGLHLGPHPGVERRQEARQRGGPDAAHERGPVGPARVQALDVGQDDQLARAEGDRERGCRGVRVDVEHLGRVVDVRGDGRHHGDATGVEQVEHRTGVDLHDVADLADVHLDAVDDDGAPTGLEQAAVLAGQADGVRSVRVEQADQLAGDLTGEDHAHDVHRLGRRHAQTATELADDPEAVEHGVDLRAAAVHDDGTQADLPEEDHVLGERALEVVVDHRVAAVLDDHERPGELLQPGQRLDEHLGLLVGTQVGAGVEDEVLVHGRRGPLAAAVLAHVEYALFSWT